MDIKLEKKKGIRKKHIPYIIGGVLFLFLLGWIIFGDHSSTLRVDARGISIGEVSRSQFNDFVRVDGQVQPITVVQLSPEEGGIVQEKVVEEGSQVRKGEVIVRLSNSQLDLSILGSEASLTEQMSIFRNTQIQMQQAKLDNEKMKLQLDLEVNRKRRTADQNKKLYGEELISRENYLQAQEDYDLAVKQYGLVIERIYQDSISRALQLGQMEEQLESMQTNLRLVRQRRENLNIRSQIDGELGLLDVVLGQNISSGQKIGQVNDLSDYKVEAMIDEHYIDRVRAGLNATFERQSASFALTIRRVFPEVREGKFRTEFIFTGERPDNIRSGQTYYINLELGQPTESIIIPKGTFFQSTGGSWIFVLDKDGKKAHRRQIRIGRQNPQYYEVLEGLEAGEQVIVSSYESYKNNEVLVLE
ncbi:HlyD family efflux transporter periplasmic adaptor subunit [Parabacteroides sp. PF5-9]|uniref:efflux RND transporter periplasmic adaptor subunit n=1 Tax=Parabacteroides sp. PF5-9 TaxID=1742404 RepID=UPI00247528A2|nr:HlyD family efflux transporter periplasmic adaptor subunit [Parabacteroides sp. PF5-9]MDH6356476.1 HlyD family secretion protein [Parabacteroides sp. PF5-9]